MISPLLSVPLLWRLAGLAVIWLMLFALASGLWQPRVYVMADNALQDWRWRLQTSPVPVSNPVLIDIDDESLRLIGPWPWPRELIAHLISQLQEAGARVVALDIAFPEAKAPEADAILQRKLISPGVVTGMHPSLGHADSLLPVACPGHIVPYPELDGVVRRIEPWLNELPALSLAIVRCDPALAESAKQLSEQWLAQLAASPHHAPASVPIPWRFNSSQFTSLSAYRLLATADWPVMKDKIVIIGSSAVGLADRIASPLQSPVAGMLVHAELLTQALQPVAEASDQRWLAQLVAYGGAFALTLLFIGQQARAAVLAWLLLAFSWGVLLALLPAVNAQLNTLVWFMLLLFAMVQAPAEWLFAQAQVSRLGRRMQRYLPAPVLAEVLRLQRSGIDSTAPQRRRITVMFADVVGYTAIAEQLSPERLALLTQQLLEVMTRSVLNNQGTLDKYIGDAVMAFWGAPLDQPMQADLACQAALDLQRKLAQWNGDQRARDFPELDQVRVSIGLHTGDAVVGELGSSQRQAYTAIGDTVNVAQRLQSVAADYMAAALVSAECAEASSQQPLRLAGSVALRGRQAPHEVYELGVNSLTTG